MIIANRSVGAPLLLFILLKSKNKSMKNFFEKCIEFSENCNIIHFGDSDCNTKGGTPTAFP
nr:MAG TPA: hypothetical protein [Caudoviricetes sp.]